MTKKKKKKIVILSILILTLTLLIGAIGLGVYQKFNQANNISAYKQATITNSDKSIEELNKMIEYNKTLTSFNYDPIKLKEQYNQISNDPKNNNIFGVITIDKIDLRLPVFKGVEENSISAGVGHPQETAFPIGTPGTRSILTSHNSTLGIDLLFVRLDEMAIGDTFNVVIGKTKFNYKVTELKVLTPEETDEYAIPFSGKEKAEVVLITCTPYGLNTHRLLVIGEIESSEEIKEQELEKLDKPSLTIGKETLLLLPLIVISIVLLFLLLRKKKNKNENKKKEA